MMQLGTDETSQRDRASARSALYRLLAHSFNFPTLEFYRPVESGEFFATVRGILNALPHRSLLSLLRKTERRYG